LLLAATEIKGLSEVTQKGVEEGEMQLNDPLWHKG
jgi:hypothetical protein